MIAIIERFEFDAEVIATALESTAKIRDFQAEYTPAATSNGSHQRMSVSVVASPRNQPKNR
jgi:hypothetical protein